MGKDDNVLINNSTGEHMGTQVVTYKRVDKEKFVKLFASNIALTFDLTSAGIKAFNVLIWTVQVNSLQKDQVELDSLTLEDFIECQDNKANLRLSYATFKRGLRELESAKIIAKTMRKGKYFINPNFVFNGDRIAFATVLEKDSKM